MLAKRTKSGSTPLHSAAVTNRHDVIRLLLENGSDEKAEDDDGLTAYDQAKVLIELFACSAETVY